MSKMPQKRLLQWGLLLFLVLSLAGYAVYSQLISVKPFYSGYDPELVYFINSLEMLSGKAYHYADHPGTPINVVGTLIFLLLKPLATWRGYTDFPYYMLLYPDRFLLVARLFMSLLHIVATFFIWRFNRDKVGLAGLTLILTSYFVAFGTGVWSQTVYWSHNAVAFSLGTVFLFVTFRVLNSARPRTYGRLAWLGAGAGFLTAIQLYFIAWIIGLLAVVCGLLLIEKQPWRVFIKSGGAVAAGAGAGFIITNLPVMHRFGYMFGWFERITTNLGRYGSGGSGVISLPVLWENFIGYQRSGFSLLFIILAALLVGLALLAFRRRDFAAHKVLWAMAAGMSVQAVVICLLVLKHPGSSYLVAVAALLPILFFLWFRLHQPEHQWWQSFYTVLAIGSLLLWGWQLVSAVQRNDRDKVMFETRSAFIDAYLTDYAAQHGKSRDDLQIFTAYTVTFDRCEPLRFGNAYSNQHFAGTINHICPNERQWNIWGDNFVVDQIYIELEDYEDNWDVIILRGYQVDAVAFFDDKDVTIQHLDYDMVFVTP